MEEPPFPEMAPPDVQVLKTLSHLCSCGFDEDSLLLCSSWIFNFEELDDEALEKQQELKAASAELAEEQSFEEAMNKLTEAKGTAKGCTVWQGTVGFNEVTAPWKGRAA